MTVETLRVAIQRRAQDLRIAALVSVGIAHHSRRKGDWRHCPCSWCEKKREATAVIGTVPQAWRWGRWVSDIRHSWRDEQRTKYRAALKQLREEGIS